MLTNLTANLWEHTVTVIASLATYPSITISEVFTLTVDLCALEILSIIDDQTGVSLAAQLYTIPSTTAFSYSLATSQTPACGYAPTAWTISVSSSASITSF
jgi:hypothetical protein